jgi:putative radical SAM enzyme (TIGR03279 family)
MAVVITQVKKGSAAHRAGVRAGDTLLCVDSEPISDLLDYQFYTTSGQFRLLLSRGEKEFSAKIKKDEYEDLGLGFESYLMDAERSCKNHCIFCFIDQNPKGMRESVYFKDDDDRLSFLFGNYITLTNLSEHDLARILRMHISPVNVSVHTTDERLRVKMMRNPNAGSALSKLRRLAGGGVRVNTQLVLCPGVNDGAALDRTLGDLGALYPAVQSIACVPVGLTGHREGLYALSPFTKEGARRVVEQVESFSSRWLPNAASAWVPRRRIFLKAGSSHPACGILREFAQLENGVACLHCAKKTFQTPLKP